LRPSVLDDLGLEVALERYAQEFTHFYTAISVDLHCELSQRLPPLVETTIYRIVQEAMTNAARHSGGDVVSVLLQERHERVRVIVEDNGHGFLAEIARRSNQSVGIHGMAERAELIGGDLTIESGDEGTSVYLEIAL
jgi:signal transduction histidine kinase